MEIILGKTAGFCYGVKRAIEEAEKEIEKNEKIYCLGEIVHNKSVIKELEEKGLIFIKNVQEANGKTIIRAHGAPKSIYKELEQKQIPIKDLTCPNVFKTHEIAEEYNKKNYFIILVGIQNHPEAIGTLSFCGEKCSLVQEKEEIPQLIEKINESKSDNILIMAQTTFNSKKFDEISKIFQDKLSHKNLVIKKTICMATELRQEETIKLSKIVDCMLIIGDKKSSNTNKLYDISIENCKNVLFIQNEQELDINKLKNMNKIGIMAGASTPKADIEQIIKKIKTYIV